MNMTPRVAQRIFLWAGIYGIIVILPQYFLEKKIGHDFPPAITHPEHFYGFVGTALAWQFAFLLIARDVIRFRAFMIPAVLEKVLFAASVLVLYAQGRVAPATVAFAGIDLFLAALFLWAFFGLKSPGDQTDVP
jgi:hypothetical protein